VIASMAATAKVNVQTLRITMPSFLLLLTPVLVRLGT
jgi:hypothetical protein